MQDIKILRICFFSTLFILLWSGAIKTASAQSNQPVLTSLQLFTETVSVLKGGMAHATRYDKVLEGSLETDTQADGLWSGGRAKISLYHISSGHPSSTLIGDEQGASNLDAPDETRIYEAWYQQRFPYHQALLKTGLIDLNQTFDVTRDAGLFLNASFGVTPTLSLDTNASIYPIPGAAIVAEASFHGYKGLAGLFQAHPLDRQHFIHHGLMQILEINHDGIKLGAWQQNGPTTSSNAGLYGIADKTLYKSGNGARLAGFIQLGASRSTINSIPYFTGGGLVLSGFYPTRREDVAGIGFANAATRGPGAAAETSIEVTYSAPITHRLILQPDFQLILHPGGLEASPRAEVFLLRAQWILF
ncbi:MAG: carbohydrate porin [Proteobacteria bacterium]|nr:carbohydrate porin [Pseudomonadota bacterium]MDE3208261.1 carbohydrate porin [Pseudomonadota bacterium]